MSSGGELAVPSRTVVAVVLRWRGKIGLFRRSSAVRHDRGLWHCLTGFVDAGQEPQAQARLEVLEETGLAADQVLDFTAGPILTLHDGDTGSWVVHTFVAETTRKRLALNWEHDKFRWVRAGSVQGYRRVYWLDEVLGSLAVQEASARPSDPARPAL